MRILLDNNVPVGVVRLLRQHQVSTSPELGWERLQNGAMLDAAETAAFDLLITADQNIQYQQNLKGRSIALVVIGSNLWPRVRGHAAILAATVDAALPGTIAFIEMLQ